MEIGLFKKIGRIWPLKIDWPLFFAVMLLTLAGLFTMSTFSGDNSFFEKQLIWIVVCVAIFFLLSSMDFHFLRRSNILISLYLIITGLLILLFIIGSVFQGARSWFDFGFASFEPVDFAKLILILMLAKYFSRRHIEIADIKHIIVSGIYASILFLLVLFQPDFGSAIIIFFVWLGMVLVAGISRKHLLLVFLVGIISFSLLWFYAFEPYQKQRIMTFLNPLTDIHGSGYNAYQATVAVGSGQIWGKGVGLGTQSKLEFLPEYQTDFIFAAFAEEWGFVGVIIIFALFGVVIWRIIVNAVEAESNFETLYGVGLAIFLLIQFILHVGINIGLLPVTGTTIPFLSYGGSHLLTEFTGLGILMGMRRYSRGVQRRDTHNEMIGIS
mgnify:CR=1 FL=1